MQEAVSIAAVPDDGVSVKERGYKSLVRRAARYDGKAKKLKLGKIW
jgi:hypothetical protein